MHIHSEPFRALTLSPRNKAIARSLGFQDPRALQSMVICKQPRIGGAVPPHQDSTFLYTDPPSAVGFWYALEDCNAENGCLGFAPGSHKRTPITRRFVRSTKASGGTEFEESAVGGKFPLDIEAEEISEERTGDESETYTLGEVKAGSLVLIHGNILHKSERNASGKSRFIYTFHIIEGRHQYDERNWLQCSDRESGFAKLS